MMERGVRRKSHAPCEAGEKVAITSKSYLSLSQNEERGQCDRPAEKADKSAALPLSRPARELYAGQSAERAVLPGKRAAAVGKHPAVSGE